MGNIVKQTSQLWSNLHRLAPMRFARYERQREPALNHLERYVRNIHLCQAFYPSLHLLEVALRSTLHRELTREYGATWFQSRWLHHKSKRLVDKVIDDLQKNQPPGWVPDPNQVIAKLTLGFWVAMLNTDHDRRIFKRVGAQVFSHRSSSYRLSRSDIQGRLQRILVLRNRISHHEAIFDNRNLKSIYDDLVFVLEMIAPAYAQLVRYECSVESVLNKRPSRLRKRIRKKIRMDT